MSQIKINMHRPAPIEPADFINYSINWFEIQWKGMRNGEILITLDGSYIKTVEGFDQW